MILNLASLRRAARCSGWLLCAWLLCLMPARAHLVAAQKGTLNIVGDAAFLVLSVPVAALQGVDDDADAVLSKVELQAHADAIRAQLLAGVQLLGPGGALPLQLVMVDIAPPDNTPQAAASHLTVLGRFSLGPASGGSDGGETSSFDGLSLQFSLFGSKAGERQQDLTITRDKDMQWLRFTPEHATHALLPDPFTLLAEYLHSGAAHVLGGADHLLFLLVVLSAGWGWRALLGVLTCFTVGHAFTLLVCVLGGWSAPERIVEPAIAATIVGMAAFDAWRRRQGRPVSSPVRLALVLGCALVHGLGLADALTGLTQWPLGSSPMLWALAGFNLGIELGQVLVAALAYWVWWGLARWPGPDWQRNAGRFATLAVMVTGSFWFAERVLRSS